MTEEATGLVLHDPLTRGLVLRAADGVRYRCDPGALCLELLLTGGPDALARFEVLHRPPDLADWLARCRLALDPAGVRLTATDLGTARRLRDALLHMVRFAADRNPAPGEPSPGEPPEDAAPLAEELAGALPTEVATVNRAAAHAPLVPEIAPDGHRSWHLPTTGEQALASVARDAVELFTGPFATRIRVCGAADCGLLFVDTSRPGRRRWCSMERCGNRHKVRELRARRSNGRPSGTTSTPSNPAPR